MSLQDELRAQKLAFATESKAVEPLRGKDLSDVCSDAGCNMLFVYLLNRWGAIYEAGALTKLCCDQDLHESIVTAYLQAGCSAEEKVASSKLFGHTPPSFRYQVHLTGKLSPSSFAKRMLKEIQQDMAPDAYVQLERLCALLNTKRSVSRRP